MKPASLPAIALLTAIACSSHSGEPKAAEGYTIDTLVPGSPFCGVHGLGVDAQDRLYAGSVVGQRIYRVDTGTGAISSEVPPPEGMADDMEFLPDGTLVWTAISQNAVRARRPNGEVVTLAKKLPSVNSIAYDTEEQRLFVAQVFGGDGLWELDPSGEKPRREILTDMGGLNGFDIGPDGMIYGPLWFKQQVVKIDPDSGELSVIADGFHTPAAANFDSQWNLYVLDTGTGEVLRVDIDSGEKKRFAQLKTSLDNLAIDSKDRIYVSNMADNSIHRLDPKTGAAEVIVEGGLSCPTALSAVSEADGDTLYLADIFALRAIDGHSGKITDIGRAHAAGPHLGYPTAVSASDSKIYSVSAEGLQIFDRQSHELLKEWKAMRGLQQVLELPDGDVVALGSGGTLLTRMDAEDFSRQHVIAGGLERVGAMASDGEWLYITQPGINTLARIDLESGQREVLNEQIETPRGLALGADGQILVMDASGRILALQADAPEKLTALASDIPSGRFGVAAGMPLPGLAVGQNGTIYAVSDRQNAIYRISRATQ